jgi:hypothetical protein
MRSPLRFLRELNPCFRRERAMSSPLDERNFSFIGGRNVVAPMIVNSLIIF